MKTSFNWKGHVLTLPEIPEDFAKEVAALSLRLQYLVSNGWNQSILDSYSSAETEADFKGKALKKFDAILLGEVRVGKGGGTRVTDPVEKEFLRIIAGKQADWFAERKKANKPKPSEELISIWKERLIQIQGDEIREEATRRVQVNSNQSTSLDDLLEGLE